MLRFNFDWEDKLPRGDIDNATFGRLTLTAENDVVWDRIEGSWHELLRFLCTNWLRIQNEGLPNSASESEKYDFSISHDLAYVFRGRSPLPSIIFTRKGLQLQIITGKNTFTGETSDIMRDLQRLGMAIAKRLHSLKGDEKAIALLSQWTKLVGPIDWLQDRRWPQPQNYSDTHRNHRRPK